MFDLRNDPDASRRLGELLDFHPRLCDLIESVGWCCSQAWWCDSDWERVQAAVAELVPPDGNGERGDYELVRDYVRSQVDRRQLDGSTSQYSDESKNVTDF
jgi:hypothetical protein